MKMKLAVIPSGKSHPLPREPLNNAHTIIDGGGDGADPPASPRHGRHGRSLVRLHATSALEIGQPPALPPPRARGH